MLPLPFLGSESRCGKLSREGCGFEYVSGPSGSRCLPFSTDLAADLAADDALIAVVDVRHHIQVKSRRSNCLAWIQIKTITAHNLY